MGIVYGLFSLMGWGVTDFLAAKASRDIGYYRALLGMQIVACIGLFGYFVFARPEGSWSLTTVATVVGVSVLFTAGSLAFFRGMQIGALAVVSPVTSAWALVTVVLSLIFLGESLDQWQIVGVGLTIVGIVLTSLNFKELAQTSRAKLAQGAGFAFLAMLGFGVAMPFMTPLVDTMGWFYPSLIERFASVVLLIVYALVARVPLRSEGRFSVLPLVVIVVIGLLDAASFLSYCFGTQLALTSIIAPVVSTGPLITVALAAAFYREKMQLTQGVGLVVTVSGLFLLAL
jgi:uncharacterized membrane protein